MTSTHSTPATSIAAATMPLRYTGWPNVKLSGWKNPRRPPRSVRLENTSSSASLTVAAHEAGRDADRQLELERHELRRVDLDVVPGEPERVQERAQLVLERVVDRAAADAVDGDEDRVPAPGPAPRRARLLHLGVPLGERRVVGHGDRALLRAERLRRVQPDALGRLRIRAAGGRQRVGHGGDRQVGDDAAAARRRRRCPARPLPTR